MGEEMMDEKMKAAFDAWGVERSKNIHTLGVPTSYEYAEWTLDYMRSQQEPEVFAFRGRDGVLQSPSVTMHSAGMECFYAHPIPSAPAVPEWQPIETAPKDGTSVLGYWLGGKHDCAIHAVKFHKGRWWEPNEDFRLSEPTHWMPLPDAPSTEKKRS